MMIDRSAAFFFLCVGVSLCALPCAATLARPAVAPRGWNSFDAWGVSTTTREEGKEERVSRAVLSAVSPLCISSLFFRSSIERESTDV